MVMFKLNAKGASHFTTFRSAGRADTLTLVCAMVDLPSVWTIPHVPESRVLSLVPPRLFLSL